MCKKLISLLLSLIILLGAVWVPAGAAAGTTQGTFVLTLDSNGGKFEGNPTKPEDSNQERHIDVTYANSSGSYPADIDSFTLTHTDSTFKFDGWYANASGTGTKIVKFDKLVQTTDHTLYAKWVKKTQQVTLNANGGTIDGGKQTTTVNIPFGTKYSATLSQTRYQPIFAKHTFVGWKESGNSFISENVVNNETAITLTAEWKEQFTVTFDANGGSVSPASKTYDDGDTYGTLPTPTRTLYTSDGWYDAKTGGTKITENSTVANNITLYAHWSPAKRMVTFNANGGDLPANTDETQELVSAGNGSYIYPNPLPTPSRTYYDFNGWFPSETGGTEITAGAVVNATTTDVTLYAHWTRRRKTFKMFTVPEGANGQYTSGNKFEELIMDCGTTYADIPKPARTGYEFDCWCSDSACSDGNVIPSNQIITLTSPTPDNLYAKWAPAEYEVTLDPNGGEFGENATTTFKVEYANKYANLPNSKPTQTGYDFAGWYLVKKPGDTDNPVDTNTDVTKTDDHTLYAHWNPKTYNVKLDYGSLIDNNNYSKPKDSIDVKMDEPLTGLPSTSPDFEKDGVKFTFYNWYTKNGAMVKSLNALTPEMLNNSGNATLYARWKYDIEFYNNTTNTANSSHDAKLKFLTGAKYEDENKFPTPTNTGKTFVGWFTATDDSARLINPSDVADGTITKLYAHWTTSEYVITINANGGKFREDQQAIFWEYTYGDTYGENLTDKNFIPAAPEGHTFDGWYTEKEGGTKLSPTDKVTKGGPIYAHWKANQFKLTFNLNYGSSSTVKTVDYNTKLSDALPSPEPERSGYAFDGWYTDSKCETPADTKILVTADITLYAKWVKAQRVTLVLNGGALPSGVPAYINVYEGGTYEKLPNPTWTGCTFRGWFDKESGGTQVKCSDKVPATASIPATLYAQWDPMDVTVTFDPNGAVNQTARSRTYKVGATYGTSLSNLLWSGHKFMGWYTQKTGGSKVEPGTVITVKSDKELEITLYAHWGYEVFFDPTDGSGSMDSQIAEMDQPFTLPVSAFTPPTGMRFGGWAPGAPNASTTYPGGSQYTVNRQVTFYATWTTAPIVITATSTSGGSLRTDDGKTNEVTVERGQDVTFVAQPNSGYELKELIVDGTSWNYVDVHTFKNVTENHTIHAVFVPVGSPSYSSCDHGSSCPLSNYSDLNAGKWYHDAVHYCVDNVIMGGTGSKFYPGRNTTRAELAVSLYNYAGRPSVNGGRLLPNTYTDVRPGDWHYQAIEWATKEGILAGYGNGKFKPNQSVTREQLVAILWRHAGEPEPRSTTLRFYDSSKVSDYAWEAMCWGTEQGILQGRSNGYLVPKGTATRAEVAEMLKNYLGK